MLLGLRDSHNRYRTIWVGTVDSSPAIVAIVPGLVVPRENGFWRIDVEQVRCGSLGQYSVDEVRLRAPGSTASARLTMDCESAARASCGESYPVGAGLELERWITYAGPTHLAEVFRSAGSCEQDLSEETGYAVHELDHPERDVPIEAAFSADGMEDLESAARMSLVCETDDLDCIDSQSGYRVSRGAGWGIVRDVSQWSVVVSLSSPGSDPEIPLPVVPGVRPPAAMLGSTGDEEIAIVPEGLPEGDRSISPQRDMAVVRTDRMVAYRVVAGAVEGPPLAIPARSDEQMVIVQWASRSQAESWNAALTNEVAATATGIGRVAWLQGCWEAVSQDRIIEEHWTAPRGESMMGVSRTLRDGALADYELMVLREEGDGLVFEAHPSGLSMVAFAATTIGEQSVVFENPQHDFPQRIGYERQGERLLSWIEGTQNAEVTRFEFPYRRAACPGEPMP